MWPTEKTWLLVSLSNICNTDRASYQPCMRKLIRNIRTGLTCPCEMRIILLQLISTKVSLNTVCTHKTTIMSSILRSDTYKTTTGITCIHVEIEILCKHCWRHTKLAGDTSRFRSLREVYCMQILHINIWNQLLHLSKYTTLITRVKRSGILKLRN